MATWKFPKFYFNMWCTSSYPISLFFLKKFTEKKFLQYGTFRKNLNSGYMLYVENDYTNIYYVRIMNRYLGALVKYYLYVFCFILEIYIFREVLKIYEPLYCCNPFIFYTKRKFKETATDHQWHSRKAAIILFSLTHIELKVVYLMLQL